MIKIAFLCIIIAIGYIHCNFTNISNNTNLPIYSPLTNVKQIDIIEDEQMKFLKSLNLSLLTTTAANNKPDDINEYYNWLNFLKTSTSTHVNSIIIPSNTIKKA